MNDSLKFGPQVSSPSDSAGRRTIRNSLDVSLLVEAAAGTGKTSELVRRLVAILAGGRARVDGIAAVTFTRKAAGELKLRLREALDRARRNASDSIEIRNLERAVAGLEEASISTIHSFCADLLRKRPVEAGVDPDFRELSEDEASRLFRRAFRQWMETRLPHPAPGLARALQRSLIRQGADFGSPLDLLRSAAWKLMEWRDYGSSWRREAFDRETLLDALVSRIGELAATSDRAANRRDRLRQELGPVRDLDAWIRRFEREQPRDYDRLEGQVLRLLRRLRSPFFRPSRTGEYAPGLPRVVVVRAREDLLRELEDFIRRADADLAALLREELLEVAPFYEELKEQVSRLDFMDLLIKTRDLIRDRPSVRRDFQEHFSHIFVDEFQDTDALQAEILLLLSADDPAETDWRRVRPVPGKLFLVGDPKQSIYRFRRADVVLYQEIKEILEPTGVRVVHLKRNFRSVRPLQLAVNAAFAPEMKADSVSGQPDYVPLESHRTAERDQPALIALPVPEPYSKWGNLANAAIEQSLPQTVAAFTDWLLRESGWRVGDPEDPTRRIPISPGHVCILFRRFVSWRRDVTREYARGLEIRGVPHVLMGSRSFHQREEVETLRVALSAIERPDDELSVYATLRGSLFWIRDSLLLRFRDRYGSLHPFRPRPEDLHEELQPVAEALEILARLHRRRNRRPIAETLSRLLAQTRAHAGFALRPAGRQVLANVQRVCDLARAFETGGGGSFRGFVEHLERLARRRTGAGAQVSEEGVDGVHLMTVHNAKGLEFPVVILADMTAHLSSVRPDKFVDSGRNLAAFSLMGCVPWELLDHQDVEAARDRAEGTRLAYVAATRARDLLVVPGLGTGPRARSRPAWLAPLEKATYPARTDWGRGRPAPGCPSFGPRSLLQNPRGRIEPCIRPGLHRPQTGDHPLVWWDPELLDLTVRPNFGLQRERILADDERGRAGQDGLARYRQWREGRRLALDSGSRPTLQVLTVTGEPSPGDPPECPSVGLETHPIPDSRPAGPRFGTLVHTLLRDVHLDAGEPEIRRLARLHGRVLGVTNPERRFAIQAVRSALDHSLLERARAARRRHRELPFLLTVEEGKLLEGTIDLAFQEEDRWIVVDFKTDVHLKPEDPGYRRQVQWYVYGLKQITGQPAEGWMLGI